MFVNQLIASSMQIIQIDSRHLLSCYMPISLVYYYTGVFCDIWTLLVKNKRMFVFWMEFNLVLNFFAWVNSKDAEDVNSTGTC